MKKILQICMKIILMVSVAVVFYKLPSIIADKISYMQLKNKDIKQDFMEEE